MNQEQLVLPADEIGWSDKSFDLALRFVMRTANLAEVREMQSWLLKNIEKSIFWSYGQQMAMHGLFKRTILLTFRNFEPSAMERAYSYVKQNPHKDLKRRNTKAIVRTIVLFVIAGLGFTLVFIMLFI